MSVTIYDNPVQLSYDLDDSSYTLFDTLVSKQVVAVEDSVLGPTTLTLSGTSNIDIQAIHDVRMYSSNGAFKEYLVGSSNGARYDRLALQVSSFDKDTILISTESNLRIGSEGSVVALGGLKFSETACNTVLSSDKTQGFVVYDPMEIESLLTVQNNQVIGQNLTVGYDVNIGRNMVIHGDFFSGAVNLWRDKIPSAESNVADQVGFAFAITDQDQLELVRYVRFNDSNTTKISQRVALFGNGIISPTSTNDASYSNYDVLSGFAVNSNSSNLTSPSGGNVNISTLWGVNNSGNIFYTSGKVGIGISAPAYDLHVQGNAYIDDLQTAVINTTAHYSISDVRLKNVMGDVDSVECLDKVSNLSIHRYTFKNDPDEKVKLGFIAQEVESIMQEAIHESKEFGLDDCKHIEMNVIMGYVVGAVKQLVVMNTDLKNNIEASNNKIQDLSNRIKSIASGLSRTALFR
jgi:hypothetical protein